MLDKQALRKYIKDKTAKLSDAQRYELSSLILEKLEYHPIFQAAKTVMLYYSLPDEPHTHEFLARWAGRKRIFLPVVKGTDIEVRRYTQSSEMREGAFHIDEPTGEAFTQLGDIDLVVVPGVAFDRCGNRLGRGRGYYDRFLSQEAICHAYRIGICFPHQVVRSIPTEPHDAVMNEVLY